MSKRRRIWTKHVSTYDAKKGRYTTDWNESRWYWQDADAPVSECKSLFGGSSKGPTLQPPPGFTDILDEISGTETVQVTTADGRKKLVTRAIERSPEEQAYLDKAKAMMTGALDELDLLLSNDPTASDQFKDVLDAFSTRQDRLTNDALNSIVSKRNNYIAQNGLDGSSAANEMRTQDAIRELQAKRDNEEILRLKKNELLGEEIQKKTMAFATGQGILDDAYNKQVEGRTFTTNTGMAFWGQDSANTAQANQNALIQYQNKKPSLGSQLLGAAASFAGNYVLPGVGTLIGNKVQSAATTVLGGFDPTTGITWSSGRVGGV